MDRLRSLEDEDGEEVKYRIVGPDEFNIADGKLSMDSPLGKTILGKRVGDETKFSSPKGVRTLYLSKKFAIWSLKYRGFGLRTQFNKYYSSAIIMNGSSTGQNRSYVLIGPNRKIIVKVDKMR